MRHDSHYVDQLVRADELPIGRKIAMHLIEANPDQPRTVLGDLSDLKQSITSKGVLEPILVRPREDGRFTIISGERRFRAALEAGLGEIPCIEMSVPDAELMEIALIENLQRKDLTPFEEAEGYLVLQEKHSYTHEQIARSVGKSRVTVTEVLLLTKLPQQVKDECRRADIQSKSFLLELSRLPSTEAMLAAIQAYQSGDTINRDVLRQAKRLGATAAGRTVSFRREYSLDYEPSDRPYRVSVVLKGSLEDRSEILTAIRDLARRIETGEIDLEKHGKFAPPPKAVPEGVVASSVIPTEPDAIGDGEAPASESDAQVETGPAVDVVGFKE